MMNSATTTTTTSSTTIEVPFVTLDDCIEIFERNQPFKLTMSQLRWLFTHEKNFEAFCRFFFDDAFTKPFAPFHNELAEAFLNGKDEVRAAPRGHGKSTVVGLGTIMWDIVNRREHYIVYTSQNHRKSVEFIQPIRDNCKKNMRLRAIYPELSYMRNVRDEEGKDREDCFDVNYIRIEAISFEKDIRGLRYGVFRPTKIVFDDIETKERVINPELRMKDLAKVNADILPALDAEKGKYKFIGTILHPESILKNKLRVRNGKIYRAIEHDGTILWPEMYSRETLDAKRKEIGSLAFAQEYLNEPAESGTSIFKREWFERAKDETLSMFEPDRIKYDFKTQGVDFAFSDRLTADSSAFGGLGKWYTDESEHHYDIVQLIWKQGMTITEQFDFIQYYSDMGKYNDNALEENSIRSMSKSLNKWSFPYTLFWTAGADAKATQPGASPTEYAMKRHTVGKPQLINRLATAFENDLFSLPYKTDRDKELTNKFIEECMTFAFDDGKLVETGIHADMPIAIAYALERAEMDKYTPAYAVVDLAVTDDNDLYYEDLT